eukprot:15431790-Alexandrium_andersonii.AAC.1
MAGPPWMGRLLSLAPRRRAMGAPRLVGWAGQRPGAGIGDFRAGRLGGAMARTQGCPSSQQRCARC